MGKRVKLGLCLMSAWLLILVPISCRKDKKEAIPPPGEKAAAGTGDLRILSVAPLGQTSSFGEIRSVIAIFDRPMVALDALADEKAPAVFKTEPP